jgi:hypothetical protein
MGVPLVKGIPLDSVDVIFEAFKGDRCRCV